MRPTCHPRALNGRLEAGSRGPHLPPRAILLPGQSGLSDSALAKLATPSTHVLKASVQDLQFFACELGLFLELLQTLRPVAHRGHFKLILHAVCGEWWVDSLASGRAPEITGVIFKVTNLSPSSLPHLLHRRTACQTQLRTRKEKKLCLAPEPEFWTPHWPLALAGADSCCVFSVRG